MKTHLTDEDIFQMAIDQLDIANPNVDMVFEIAEKLGLEYDRETGTYKNPDFGDIYKLKLHEIVDLPFGISIMRVPGGWIYNCWDFKKDSFKNGIFVPYR